MGMFLGCHGSALEVTWGPSGALGCHVDAVDGLGSGIWCLGNVLGVSCRSLGSEMRTSKALEVGWDTVEVS